MSLHEAWLSVRDFHRVMDQPHPDRPHFQTVDLVQRRAGWIEEEVAELHAAGDVIDQADAYLDIAYFALGGLVELGVDPGPLFTIVHAANMAKVWPDGTVHKTELGKVIKPPGWVAPEPELAAEIGRQLSQYQSRTSH